MSIIFSVFVFGVAAGERQKKIIREMKGWSKRKESI